LVPPWLQSMHAVFILMYIYVLWSFLCLVLIIRGSLGLSPPRPSPLGRPSPPRQEQVHHQPCLILTVAINRPRDTVHRHHFTSS
jgi:hypothetical protein